LRQPWKEKIAPHHDRVAELLGVIPLSVICQELHDEAGAGGQRRSSPL
jgi:hypothetical protein